MLVMCDDEGKGLFWKAGGMAVVCLNSIPADREMTRTENHNVCKGRKGTIHLLHGARHAISRERRRGEDIAENGFGF